MDSVMGIRRVRAAACMAILAGLIMAMMAVGARVASAHSWSTNCSVGYGLLWIYEHKDYNTMTAGATDKACEPDSNWGSGGEISGFNDRMSSFHLRDRSGDGLRLCVRFYENTGYAGASTVATGGYVGDGNHAMDPELGSWNDRVSSHLTYGTSSTVC